MIVANSYEVDVSCFAQLEGSEAQMFLGPHAWVVNSLIGLRGILGVSIPYKD